MVTAAGEAAHLRLGHAERASRRAGRRFEGTGGPHQGLVLCETTLCSGQGEHHCAGSLACVRRGCRAVARFIRVLCARRGGGWAWSAPGVCADRPCSTRRHMLSLPSSSTMRTAMSSLSHSVIESYGRQAATRAREQPAARCRGAGWLVRRGPHLALLLRELLLHHGDLGDEAQ